MFFFSFSFNKQDTKTRYNKSIKNKNKNNQAKDLPDQKKKQQNKANWNKMYPNYSWAWDLTWSVVGMLSEIYFPFVSRNQLKRTFWL